MIHVNFSNNYTHHLAYSWYNPPHRRSRIFPCKHSSWHAPTSPKNSETRAVGPAAPCVPIFALIRVFCKRTYVKCKSSSSRQLIVAIRKVPVCVLTTDSRFCAIGNEQARFVLWRERRSMTDDVNRATSRRLVWYTRGVRLVGVRLGVVKVQDKLSCFNFNVMFLTNV